ncbi:MAG: RHS repeat-associated core domain-containing protein [Tahibacter sp.]
MKRNPLPPVSRPVRKMPTPPIWRRAALTTTLCAAGVVICSLPCAPVDAQVFPAPTTLSAGSTPGDFDVSPGGEATYRIPLALAPGRQGIEPALALLYHSGGDNGHLGVGWSLEGLSQIARCGATPMRDGASRAIQWDATDNLCIDGEKLLLISGTAQTDGAVYATERESFRKVVGVGTPHRGFRVNLPDGKIATYGITPECGTTCTASVPVHAPPNGLTQVDRAWNLASLSDRFGNWMRIEWGRRHPTSDPALAESAAATYAAEDYPVAIRYTGHDGTPALSPQRTVTFTYTDRTDDEAGYNRGVQSMLSKRLSKITSTIAGVGTYREYRLAYHASVASQRSLLGSVTECGGDGACLPATTFTWQEAPRVFGSNQREDTPIVAGNGKPLQARRKLGAGLLMADVNGDGRDDIVYVKGATDTTRTWRIALAYPTDGASLNGGAPALPACAVSTGTYRCEIDTGIAAPSEVSAQVLDYNGDGRSDLLLIDNRADQTLTTWKVLQSGGNGFTVINTFVTDHPFTDGISYERGKRVHLADMNGDGRADLVVCEPRLLSGVGQPWHLRLATGSGWGSETLLPFFPNASKDCRNNQVMFIDVNGDGATDMLSGGYDQLYFAATYNGSSFSVNATSLRTIINGFWQGAGQVFFTDSRTIDVNGDGLLDVIADRDLPQSAGTMDVFLNTGAGFVPGQTSGYAGVNDQDTEPTLGQSARLDYDGDGRDDLLITNTCPSGRLTATCANPRWMVLDATANAPQLGDTDLPFYARRELAGCTNGGAGSGCIAHRTGPSSGESWFGYQQARIGDVNGDQLPDLLMVENDKVIIFRNQGQPASDRIVEIRDGLAWASIPTIRITYKPTTDGSVLSMPLSSCAFPLNCTRPAGYLVAAHYVDTGVGSNLQEYRYNYSDPRRDVRGGGFLGYRSHRVTRVANGAVTTTTYNPAEAEDRGNGRYWYPFARLPQRVESATAIGGGRYQSIVVDHVYDSFPFYAGRTRYVRQTEHTSTVREGTSTTAANNPVQMQTAVQTSHDGYGNPLTVTTTTGVSTLRNTTSYINDSGNWILGQPTKTSVSSTVGAETLTRVTRRRYDAATGRAIGVDVESPAQATSTIGYDAVGNVISVSETDLGTGTTRTTTSSYDADPERQFVAQATNPLGHITRYEYDRRQGKASKITSPNGVAISLAYDFFGRPLLQARDGGGAALYRYDRIDDGAGRSHVETMTKHLGGTILSTTHDRRGRPVRHERIMANSQVAMVDQSYDLFGRMATRSVPYVQGTTPALESWSYDGIHRAIFHKHADGALDQTRYEGLTVLRTDPLGHTTTTLLDAEAQPVRVTDAMGGVTRFQFGAFGSLRSVTDPLGNVTRTDTDSRGHVRSIDDPDTGLREFAYDALGRRILEKDALGRSIAYEYDLLDRLVQRKDADGITSYTYDSAAHGIGAMAKALSPEGFSESYAYDDNGRLGAISTAAGDDSVSQKFGYDDAGRVSAMLLAPSAGDAFPLAYEYASDGTLLRIAEKAGDTPLYEVLTRNARGQIVEETFRGGTTTGYSIDARNGRTTAIKTSNPVQTAPLQSLSYRYDNAGNIVERTDNLSGISEKLAYDALDRLERSTVCKSACVERPMKYDAIGNVVAKWDIGDYSYNATKPHAVVKAGGVSYAYDAVGNQVQRGSEKRVFTATDRLAALVPSSGPTSRYEYDAFGRRVRESTGSNSAFHVMDLFERSRDGSGTTDRFTVKVAGRSVAVMSRNGSKRNLRFLHPDVLGSANVISETDGSIVAKPVFDVFGRSVVGDWGGAPTSVAADAHNDGYTGHRHDAETGLVDMGGRQYDPALARFLQADRYVQAPYRSQSFNRYSYVFNNPLRYIDPSGFEGEERDIEMDPAYVYGDAGDQGSETYVDMDTAYIYGDVGDSGEGEGEGEGEGDYDDTDDGDEVQDNDDPGFDDRGFDDRDPPSDLLDGAGHKASDIVDALKDAGDTLNRKGKNDPSVDEDEATHAIEIMGMGVAVAGAIAIAIGVAGALEAGKDVAGGAALLGAGAATVPAPVELPPLTPPTAPAPPLPPSPPATYQAGHGINLAEDNFGHALNHVAPDPGKLDVVVHGNELGFGLPDKTPISPQQLAQMIKSDFRYNGGAIRLFSCESGKSMAGAAQQLANALGVDVYAAPQALDLYGNGLMTMTDDVFLSSPGNFSWELFSPK